MDYEFVSEVIARGPSCEDCLARKTNVRGHALRRILNAIGEIVPVTMKRALCDGCGRETDVYLLGSGPQ